MPTHPPEPPKLRRYIVTFDSIELELHGYYNDDQGHYDTALVGCTFNGLPSQSVLEMTNAVQPDYDALIRDCLLNGSATEV